MVNIGTVSTILGLLCRDVGVVSIDHDVIVGVVNAEMWVWSE